MKAHKVSLILPCYNEEQALPLILKAIPEFINEVIVVDNGSTDKSRAIAQQYPVMVVFEEKRGYGSALIRGINESKGDVLVLMDCDGTYSFEDVRKMLHYMEEHSIDFLHGCRLPIEDKNAMSLINNMCNRLTTRMINFLFNLNIKDFQSGLIVFKRELWNSIAFKNKGMEFSQNIKIYSHLHKGSRCAERKIDYKPRIGKSKFSKVHDSICILTSLANICIARFVK